MALLADPPVWHDSRSVVTGAQNSDRSTRPNVDAGFIWSGVERGNLAVG
ncbi:MAG: hypothetical protein JWM70_1104 [Microbacteriaceae bacterium]|nr:hypothetical protein [Microbacteriaceae bacterium]